MRRVLTGLAEVGHVPARVLGNVEGLTRNSVTFREEKERAEGRTLRNDRRASRQ